VMRFVETGTKGTHRLGVDVAHASSLQRQAGFSPT
jgi:hypothetical protein